MKTLCLIFIFSMLSVFTEQVNSQPAGTKYRSPSETSGVVKNEQGKVSFIAVNPVTNREYITYLCWLYNVYRDYPEEFFKAFPGIDTDNLGAIIGDQFDVDVDFKRLALSTKDNRDYIFNPWYIDYPVKGISWEQCRNYLLWLTDRYNERALIKAHELWEDPNQVDEHNFNTESYLLNQYEGVVRKLKHDTKTGNEVRSGWETRIYMPAFRLPLNTEINYVKDRINQKLMAYKPSPFLKYWTDMYVKVKGDSIVIFLYSVYTGAKGICISQAAGNPVPDWVPQDLLFEKVFNKPFFSADEIYDSLGMIKAGSFPDDELLIAQKDKLGKMKVILTGETTDHKPVYRYRIPRQNKNISFPESVFRFAVDAVR